VAALIFGVSTWIGVRAVGEFRASGGVQDFYQRRFGPAVMLACGRAFREPDAARVPALAAFLAERSDAFDCAQLPATLETAPLDAFQSTSRYLLLTAAAAWRMAGVSWAALAAVAGALFGAVAALTYAVLRTALSRPLALLMCVVAITSTPNVMLVPQLRDYAKGPFLLAVILIMGWLVTAPADWKRTLRLAGLAGAVIGLGLGFRTDLMIAVAPFVVTLMLLVPTTVTIRTRAAALGVFLATFLIVAFPILRGYAQGSNTGHVALLGLAVPFDGPLRIAPSIYEFAGQYNDSLAYSIINSYAIRLEHRRVLLGSVEYEGAARGYLGHLARTFPADLITRFVAAVRAVPHYFLDTSLYAPAQARGPVVRGFYRLRGAILRRLAPFSFAAVILAIVGASAVNPRAAWLAVLVMAGFAGVSALQFHERHFFYLQFVPWLAFGVVAESALDFLRMQRRWPPVERIVRALIADAVLVGAVFAVVLVAHAYQQRAATALFSRYEAAPRRALPAMTRHAADGRILFTTPRWLDPMAPGSRWVEARLAAIEFRGDRCGAAALPVVVRYSGEPADVDLSEQMIVHVRASAAPTTVLAATFDRADESIRFRGFEVPWSQADCVAGLSIVDGLDATPLLLTAQLAPGWRSERLFERLR
jgi:hypothetical protein